MDHQAHAHTNHDEVQVAVKNEDGCADSWAAILILSVVILTTLFWLTGHAG